MRVGKRRCGGGAVKDDLRERVEKHWKSLTRWSGALVTIATVAMFSIAYHGSIADAKRAAAKQVEREAADQSAYRERARRAMELAWAHGRTPGETVREVEMYYLGLELPPADRYRLANALGGAGSDAFYANPPIWFEALLSHGYVASVPTRKEGENRVSP